MRAVTRWCSRLLAHWFIGYLGFVVDISFFMVGVRKPGKNNLLSLVGIQRASPSSQCWCTQSQMAEMLSRTTLCQCRSPKYPGFQAACQGWRIPPYPTHLIYYCTILVGWYMLIFIPGLGGRGSPDGAKKISGRLPPTRSHPRQLEAPGHPWIFSAPAYQFISVIFSSPHVEHTRVFWPSWQLEQDIQWIRSTPICNNCCLPHRTVGWASVSRSNSSWALKGWTVDQSLAAKWSPRWVPLGRLSCFTWTKISGPEPPLTCDLESHSPTSR